MKVLLKLKENAVFFVFILIVLFVTIFLAFMISYYIEDRDNIYKENIRKENFIKYQQHLAEKERKKNDYRKGQRISKEERMKRLSFCKKLMSLSITGSGRSNKQHIQFIEDPLTRVSEISKKCVFHFRKELLEMPNFSESSDSDID
jgi:hypothetical protein